MISDHHLLLARLDPFAHLQGRSIPCCACGHMIPYAQPGAVIVIRAEERRHEFADYVCRQCRGLEQSRLLNDIVNLQARQGQLLEENFRSALQHFLLSEPKPESI